MNTKKIATLLGTVTATVCLISVTGQAANASTFYNGWNYAIDATGDYVGSSEYEIYGIAIKEDVEQVYVAISSQFGLDGENGYHWGDLFFNFSDLSSLNNAQGNLYAINFDNFDNTPNGVYANVEGSEDKATSVVHTYYDYNTRFPDDKNMGDLSANDSYFAPTEQNILYGFNPNTATKLGDLLPVVPTVISNTLAFDHFGVPVTDEVFVFGFDKQFSNGTSWPTGSYIAHIFEDCGNDGIAIAVPEPSAMAGFVGLGLTVLGGQFSKRRKGSGVSQ